MARRKVDAPELSDTLVGVKLLSDELVDMCVARQLLELSAAARSSLIVEG
jgi:hypothetical protein